MGGVDKGDQLRKYYHVRNKSHKYYRYIYIFFFIFFYFLFFFYSLSLVDTHPVITLTKHISHLESV